VHIERGETGDEQEGGQDESDAAQDKPLPARPDVAQVHGHLGRVGAGDEVGRGHQVEELGVRQPFPPDDDLVMVDGDVGRRAAKCGEAHAQKQQNHLAQGVFGRRRRTGRLA